MPPVVFKPPNTHLQASSKHNNIDPGIFNSSQHTDKETHPAAVTVGILKLPLLQKLKTVPSTHLPRVRWVAGKLCLINLIISFFPGYSWVGSRALGEMDANIYRPAPIYRHKHTS